MSCEADTLEDIQGDIYDKFGLVGAHTSMGADVAVYVRGQRDGDQPSRVQMLYELSTDEIHAGVFLVTFGATKVTPQFRVSESDPEYRPTQRAGISHLVVAVFHLHHEAANKKVGRARNAFQKFLQACLNFRVDIFAGDANQGAYKYYNQQTNRDMTNSLVQVLTRRMVHEVNTGLPYARRLGYKFLTNNHSDNFTNDDPDCCVMCILSWGKTKISRLVRSALEGSHTEHASDAASSAQSTFHSVLESRVSELEVVDTSDVMQAPLDFDVRQSLRVLQLDNRALWLPDRDTSWHLPILVTLRETMIKNWRQRTEAGSKNQIERAINFRQRQQDRQVTKGKGKGKDKGKTTSKSRVSESASSSSTSQAQASSSTSRTYHSQWTPTAPWQQDERRQGHRQDDRRQEYQGGYQQQRYQQYDDQQQQHWQQWQDRDWYGKGSSRGSNDWWYNRR